MKHSIKLKKFLFYLSLRNKNFTAIRVDRLITRTQLYSRLTWIHRSKIMVVKENVKTKSFNFLPCSLPFNSFYPFVHSFNELAAIIQWLKKFTIYCRFKFDASFS